MLSVVVDSLLTSCITSKIYYGWHVKIKFFFVLAFLQYSIVAVSIWTEPVSIMLHTISHCSSDSSISGQCGLLELTLTGSKIKAQPIRGGWARQHILSKLL